MGTRNCCVPIAPPSQQMVHFLITRERKNGLLAATQWIDDDFSTVVSVMSFNALIRTLSPDLFSNRDLKTCFELIQVKGST